MFLIKVIYSIFIASNVVWPVFCAGPVNEQVCLKLLVPIEVLLARKALTEESIGAKSRHQEDNVASKGGFNIVDFS